MGKTPQIKKLEGVISGLIRELDELAPYSDRLISASPARLSNNFNASSLIERYISDLPRRLALERRLLIYKRRLAALQNTVFADTLALAA